MLKELEKNMLISNVVLLVVGLILTIWPDATLDVAVNLVGSLILIFGAVNLFVAYKTKNNNYLNLFLGILSIMLGIYVIVKSDSVISIIHILIGIAILADGITNLKTLIDIKNNSKSWIILLIGAIITTLLGILLIIKPYWIAKLATRIGGIIILISSVEGLWLTYKIKK